MWRLCDPYRPLVATATWRSGDDRRHTRAARTVKGEIERGPKEKVPRIADGVAPAIHVQPQECLLDQIVCLIVAASPAPQRPAEFGCETLQIFGRSHASPAGEERFQHAQERGALGRGNAFHQFRLELRHDPLSLLGQAAARSR